jgi:class 3 adenylate cyclase
VSLAGELQRCSAPPPPPILPLRLALPAPSCVIQSIVSALSEGAKLVALADDLKETVKSIFDTRWDVRDGQVVPEPEDLRLGNDAVKFARATVLYADLHGSTKMVDSKKWWFAAEIYKTYLHCATKIIKDQGGAITSYDGDRVMGFFIGNMQSTNSAKCALKINYAVQNIINPAIKAKYTDTDFQVRQSVGIDTSEIHVARTGVRGDNDLVWVGRAANYAAKLTELDHGQQTWITDTLFSRLDKEAKYGANGDLMWKEWIWTEHDERKIYSSTWWWEV